MLRLPAIKDTELIKVLLKLGFVESSRKGTSHNIFKHSDGRRTTVSRHKGKDIPRGTLRAILRDVDILPEEFEKLL